MTITKNKIIIKLQEAEVLKKTKMSICLIECSPQEKQRLVLEIYKIYKKKKKAKWM
jgi:hypothetical protein